MNINKIKTKEQKILDAIKVLKSEFVGIDEIIDNVMNNIRSWYMFPELQEKPITICLWGLTGCGKTSLVNRICELLDVKEDVLYYNFAKLGEEDSETIENSISDTFSNVKSNRVFVLDEFQYAASLKQNGEEKDNKQSLKPFWELIDTGVFHYKFTFNNLIHLSKMYDTICTISQYGARLDDNKLIGLQSIYENAKDDVKGCIDLYFNWNDKFSKEKGYYSDNSCWSDTTGRYVNNDKNCYLTCHFLCELLDIYAKVKKDANVIDYTEFKEMILRKSIPELIKFIEKLIKVAKKGYSYDYKKSIVFILGNLDEAYDISYNVDPDMDADQFHAITSKMTLVDIKEALKSRFRNEQIARFGNIMYAYPSFSTQNFVDIIKLSLNNYADSVFKETNIKIEFDQSVIDAIYKDSVFPTHGTRPIFSSIHEIIKTKLPLVFTHFIDNSSKIKTIAYSYCNDKIKATIGNGESVEFEQKLKLDSLRSNDKDERQAITAVHESGHFIMYAMLFGKMPEKLLSKTVSAETNGFMLKSNDDDNDYLSAEDYIKNIKVSLAGYCAEKVVFGENNLTSGASKDLEQATILASKMYKEFGMYGNPYVQTYVNDANYTHGGMILPEDVAYTNNKEIIKLLEFCCSYVCTVLNDNKRQWKTMFAESAKYLANNISMSKDKMKELYDLVPEKEKVLELRDDDFYRNKLNCFNA